MSPAPSPVPDGPPDWMADPAVRAVIEALAAGDVEARFVGGCVRDTLLGRPVQDIDIATPAPPERVTRLAEDAGLKVVPTGIAHGTVTVIAEGRPFEVTTLRVDVATDGRRATVAFTDDWAADAARRDFTINTIFWSPDGAVYDPFDGRADLAAGRIRFVGDPESRIREDVLRLLRFFRFHAWYGRSAPDADGLAACTRLADLLPTLSGERVAQELLRLLAAETAHDVAALMAEAGIWRHVLPELGHLDRLRALVTVEGASEGADPVRRLGAVLDTDRAGALAVAERLRLSNAQRDRLAAMTEPANRIADPPSLIACRRAAYRLGSETVRDLLLIGWADAVAARPEQDRFDCEAWRADLDLVRDWPVPRLPVGGRDVVGLGVEPGPAVGKLLRRLEAWWIDGDFAADKRACLERLKAMVAERGAA